MEAMRLTSQVKHSRWYVSPSALTNCPLKCPPHFPQMRVVPFLPLDLSRSDWPSVLAEPLSLESDFSRSDDDDALLLSIFEGFFGIKDGG